MRADRNCHIVTFDMECMAIGHALIENTNQYHRPIGLHVQKTTILIDHHLSEPKLEFHVLHVGSINLIVQISYKVALAKSIFWFY